MSCSWGFYCKTCGSKSGHGLNHGDGVLDEIARVVPLIKQLCEADTSGYLEISILGWYSCSNKGIIEWICEHGEHDLELCNEYGERKPLTG